MSVPAAEAGDVPDLDGGHVLAAADDVVVRARTGDGAALAELWSTLSPAVAAFARGRGAVDVDEITNDAFLAAFRALPGFVGDLAAFRALLFTITRRRVVDESRQRSRRIQAVPWTSSDDVRTTNGPEHEVLAQAGWHDLRRRLDRLTVDQRDVVLLRLVADLSLEEVAAVLGKRVGTVKSLQRRAVDTLRRTWTAHPPDPSPSDDPRKGPLP